MFKVAKKSWKLLPENVRRHMIAAAAVTHCTGAKPAGYIPGIQFTSMQEESFTIPVSSAEALMRFASSMLFAARLASSIEDAKMLIVQSAYPEFFEDPPIIATSKITKNWAKCKVCGDIIESKHVHDYVTCKCGEISVDGGLDYFKRGAKNLDNIIELDDNGSPIKVNRDASEKQ